MAVRRGVLVLAAAASLLAAAASGAALVGDRCAASSSSSSSSCGTGMRCATCSPLPGAGPAVCSRTAPVNPKTHGTGLAFNRYSWLTTHNSFAVSGTVSPIGSPIVSPPNQEDTVTAQLKNGVRGLMLDTYDFKNDVWLCHSFSGKCFDFTAYQPALKVLKEIQAFLDSNPSEVITIFVEDYAAPGSLAKVFGAAGLTKFMFPAAKMPKNGGDWPLLKDMIAQNHRLLVFTSKQGKESSDGIAHEWSYVVESQYGSEGLVVGACPKRAESRPMDSSGQSLVLMNFFTTNPSQSWACGNNSAPLISKLKACYNAAANRWPNFIAVDFYMRSTGGGAALATDVANGRLQCGCDNIAYCKPNATSGTCAMSSHSPSPSPSPSLAPASSPTPTWSLSPSSSPAPAPSRTPPSSPLQSPYSYLSPSLSPTLTPATSPSSSPSPYPLQSPSSYPSPSLAPTLSTSSSPSPYALQSPYSYPSISLPPTLSQSSSPSPYALQSPSSYPSISLPPTSYPWTLLSPALAPIMPPSSSPSPSPSSSPSPSPSQPLPATAAPRKGSSEAGNAQEALLPESSAGAESAAEAPPESSTVAANAPEAISPGPAADEDSGAAAAQAGTSGWSFFLGLASLALISLS